MTQENKRKKKWIIRGLVLGLLILIAAPFVANALIQSALDNALEKLRAQGYPTNLQELADYYPAVPSDDNAALIYEEAFGLIKEPEDLGLDPEDVLFYELDSKILLKPGIRRPARVKDATLEFLAGHDKLLEAIREAALKPKCRFQLQLHKGDDMPVSHVDRMLKCLWISLAKAVLSADGGNATDCTEWLHRAFSIARSTMNEPVMVSQIFHLHYMAQTIDVMEYCLGMVSLNQAQLEELDNVVEQTYDEDWIRTGLNSVFATAMTNWDRVVHMGEKYKRGGIWGARLEALDENRHSAFYDLGPIVALNKLQYLYLINQHYGHRTRTFVQQLAEEETINRTIDNLSSLYQPCQNAMFLHRVTAKKYAYLRTAPLLAKVTIASEIYRSENGVLPKKLEWLRPYLGGLILDPFTDKPLLTGIKTVETELTKEYADANPQCERIPELPEPKEKPSDDPLLKELDAVFKLDEPGNIAVAIHIFKVWMVYSVGPNLKDDGGEGDDIVMMLPIERSGYGQ